MAANPYWTDARLATQQPSTRALTLPSPVVPSSVEAVGARAAVRRRDFALPSWVVFCMIMLATFAVCVTVTIRTHAGMGAAEKKFEQVSTHVEMIKSDNAMLRERVKRLRSDPRAIEATARERMNMVRPNEIVVPLE
jgi:cell division protein FtsB